MKPTQEEIDQMIEMITKYNNAKTAEEGFGALNGLISIGTEQLNKNELTNPPLETEKKV